MLDGATKEVLGVALTNEDGNYRIRLAGGADPSSFLRLCGGVDLRVTDGRGAERVRKGGLTCKVGECSVVDLDVPVDMAKHFEPVAKPVGHREVAMLRLRRGSSVRGWGLAA